MTQLQGLLAYHRPTSLEEVVQSLAEGLGRTLPLGGGTHLVASGDETINTLVDVTACGIDGIFEEQGELVVGGAATLAAIAASPLTRELWGGVLAQAASQHTSQLVANAATAAGNLISGYARADLPPVWLVCEARARLRGPEGEREVPVAELLEVAPPDHAAGASVGAILPNHAGWTHPSAVLHLGRSLITQFRITAHPHSARAAYRKLGRTAADTGLAAAAVWTDLEPAQQGGARGVRELRVALGCLGRARRLAQAEALLSGAEATPGRLRDFELAVRELATPDADFRSGPDYRRRLAGVLARRALESLL